jgi:two-component system, LuxR family, response regulator FixJ
MNNEGLYHAIFNRDRLIHILDADPNTCEALSVLFRLEGFQTEFSVDTASFAMAIERRHPTLVIANLKVGNDTGLSILQRVKEIDTGTPVIMLADTRDVETAVQLMKAGAADVVSNPVDKDYLLGVVREALRHDVPLAGAESGRRAVEVRGFSQLTPREREVLQLITNGQSNKEAGRELGISPRTIEVHRARVMEKLGARNTADLMRIVLTS